MVIVDPAGRILRSIQVTLGPFLFKSSGRVLPLIPR
jgi:hypothetical protein